MAKRNDTLGIDLRSVTGQIKSNLWDLFRDSMYSYLKEGRYSEDEFKGFLQDRSFKVPVNLPKNYGIDFDVNKRLPGTGVRDDFRLTLRKKF
tara:strand:+ start:104 stop:379 length:276 start_codon:yes stop_codon:yes gene_type:complete